MKIIEDQFTELSNCFWLLSFWKNMHSKAYSFFLKILVTLGSGFKLKEYSYWINYYGRNCFYHIIFLQMSAFHKSTLQNVLRRRIRRNWRNNICTFNGMSEFTTVQFFNRQFSLFLFIFIFLLKSFRRCFCNHITLYLN